MFHIVTFDNGPCHAKTGEHGTCFSQKECDGLGGSASGTCANGFGVCCVLTVTCGKTISVNNTYFVNENHPGTITYTGADYDSLGHLQSTANLYGTPSTCYVTLEPPYGTCQILLEFVDFELSGPTQGDCTNDTFVVHGANPGCDIPTLCGNNAGQHMYVDVDNSQGPFKLAVLLSSLHVPRRWKIKVSFIEATNPCKAPARCLQYYKETSGSISSFNYHGTPGMMLNNQKYTICFAYVPGYCDIGIDFHRLDLGNTYGECTDDYVAVSHMKFCGDHQQLSVVANATGPIHIGVCTDDSNEKEEEGFYAQYLMLGCH
ncbi:uncharacterized protein LOC135095399 [Scylla paramamosain]|uniref:uncharacterized protein LOC135095399 n=1 Tax=Scylla paramamosain TaxID=85552 RepID=UPI0030826C62